MKLFLKQEKEGIFIAARHGLYRGKRGSRSFYTGREIHSKQENNLGKRNGGIMDIHMKM